MFPITSDFAKHVARGDPGVDWGTPQGTPLFTPARAKVRSSRPDVRRADGSPSYGGYMILELLEGPHAGTEFGFAHLSELRFNANRVLDPGTCFALTGGRPGTAGAGNSSGPHLHGNARRDGKLIDPTSLTPMFFEEADMPQFTDEEAAQLRALLKSLGTDGGRQLGNLLKALAKRGATAGQVPATIAAHERRIAKLERSKP